MASETNELKNELKKEALKQLIIGGIMVLVVVVAAYAERQASAPDPVPLQLKGWWEGRQAQRQEDRDYESSRKRLWFEVFDLLGPGALAHTDIDR
jgi:hypothetical protein